MALTAQWMLTSGRRLNEVPLMHDLGEDQLIDFWADDHYDAVPTSAATSQKHPD